MRKATELYIYPDYVIYSQCIFKKYKKNVINISDIISGDSFVVNLKIDDECVCIDNDIIGILPEILTYGFKHTIVFMGRYVELFSVGWNHKDSVVCIDIIDREIYMSHRYKRDESRSVSVVDKYELNAFSKKCFTFSDKNKDIVFK
jgi:hypothetical protein